MTWSYTENSKDATRKLLELTNEFSKVEDTKLIYRRENKMAEEQLDVEYISLHGYIRNTPSYTEVHAEYHMRVDRSTWPVEKNI